MSRVIAQDFVSWTHAYLRSGWNQLDFVVVSASWLPLLFPDLNNFTSMRAFRCTDASITLSVHAAKQTSSAHKSAAVRRALRPLRTINRLPGLRRQVDTICESLPYLLDVAMLAGFVMIVFGVLGLQLFKGMLHYRCFEPVTVTYDEDVFETGDVVTEPVDPQTACRRPDAISGDTGSTCAEGLQCKWYGKNPMYGTLSFDNIFVALMTIFQCITLEGWIDVAYTFKHVAGWPSILFFSFVVMYQAPHSNQCAQTIFVACLSACCSRPVLAPSTSSTSSWLSCGIPTKDSLNCKNLRAGQHPEEQAHGSVEVQCQS